MVTFSKIKDEGLREMVRQSLSIQSLTEEEQQKMIDEIADLPENAVDDLMVVLEEEKVGVKKIIDKESEENGKAIKEYQGIIDEIAMMEKEFKREVSIEEEKISRKDDSSEQEALLNQLKDA